MLPAPTVLAALSPCRLEDRYSCEALTIKDGIGKKRSELVLATNYEGIEIYDVRASKLLSGHSVPPTERFTCPPVTVVVKGKATKHDERFTYWATIIGNSQAHSSNVKLSCLYEGPLGTILETREIPRSSRNEAMIKSISILNQISASASHHVLVLQSDGNVMCFSAQIEEKLWQGSLELKQETTAATRIETTAVLSVADAKSGMLKAREDVLASFVTAQGSNSFTEHVLAVLVTEPLGRVRLRYFRIGAGIVEVLALDIPSDINQDTTLTWTLHAKSGKLYQHVREAATLHLYDLTGLKPRTELSLPMGKAESFLRLSSQALALASRDEISILDSRWRSIQAVGPAIPKENGSPASVAAPSLLANFASLGILVGATQEAVLIFNLSEQRTSLYRPKKRKRTFALVDAVGHGYAPSMPLILGGNDDLKPKDKHVTKSIGRAATLSSSESAARKIQAHFDPLLEGEDIEAYDSEMLKALTAVSQQKRGTNPLAHIAQPYLVAYAICGLFEVQELRQSGSGEVPLSIRKMAPETFRFLLTHGVASIANIEKALRQSGQISSTESMRSSAIITALVNFDPSLQVLIYYLSSAPLLSAEELVTALPLCLQAVRQSENATEQKFIEEGAAQLNKDAMNNDEGPGMDTVMTIGSKDNTKIELEFGENWPDPDPQEDHLHNARAALSSCLSRLSLCHDKDIQLAFRHALTPAEIITLIDYIRIDLASGGWLARYVDDDLWGEDDLSMQTSQVNVAAKILNCAVDGLGATAWLLGSAGELRTAQNEDKVAYMRAEINAALEGIENAASLQHLLQSVLLYAESSAKMERASSAKKQDIVSVPSTTDGKQGQMLPLDMKKLGVSRTRIIAGGKEVPRSARALAYLESKIVAEYTFERITI